MAAPRKESITEQTILGEISGKNAAIHAYDKVVWQVRTGFPTLTFGGWAFILKGAIESGKSILHIKEYLYVMIVISIILGLAGFLIDRNYVRRKFRVVNSLSELQEIIVNNKLDIDDLDDSQRAEIVKHIGIAGDSGSENYRSKGHGKEIFVTKLIYSIVVLACLLFVTYISVN